MDERLTPDCVAALGLFDPGLGMKLRCRDETVSTVRSGTDSILNHLLGLHGIRQELVWG